MCHRVSPLVQVPEVGHARPICGIAAEIQQEAYDDLAEYVEGRAR